MPRGTSTSHDMAHRSLPTRISHLAHLVSATTSLFSACLSLNALISHCTTRSPSSRDTLIRLEAYHNALQTAGKSLTTFIDYVGIQLSMMPKEGEALSYGNQPGFARIEAAYDSLYIAGVEIGKLPDMLESIWARQEWMDVNKRGDVWRGWPQCKQKEEVEMMCETLVNLRDSGGESDVGWSEAWRQLAGVEEEEEEEDEMGDDGWLMARVRGKGGMV